MNLNNAIQSGTGVSHKRKLSKSSLPEPLLDNTYVYQTTIAVIQWPNIVPSKRPNKIRCGSHSYPKPIYSYPAPTANYSGPLAGMLPIIYEPQDLDAVMTSDNKDDSESLPDGPVPESMSHTPSTPDDGSLFDGSVDEKNLVKELSDDEAPLPGADTPVGMSATLMPHQRLGLEFLLKQEKGHARGSILADDMGLGKTIQATALMLAHPPTCPNCGDGIRKTTLVVGPLALLKQWPREIDEKIKDGHKLKVHVYHGAGKKISVGQLMEYDVVLTNYDTLGVERVSV